MTTPVTEEHESSDGAEYGHDGPLDFPTCAAEQPRGYGPMDLPTSAAAEVQAGAGVAGGTDGRFIGGCVGLHERAREGGHDAGYDVQLRRGAQPRGHPPGMAQSIGPDERGGGTCVLSQAYLVNDLCLLFCIVRMNAFSLQPTSYFL